MIIAHRINELNEEIAKEVFSKADGIEFDIRDSNGEIIVQHDPYKSGQLFREFITFFDPSKFYIVNVKSEGIETLALKLLEERGIYKFFLLDCSIPMMIKLSKNGERRLAVRFSEYESIETVLSMKELVEWVWVDCFSKMPLTKEISNIFSNNGLKTCIVSPELQSQPEKVSEYSSVLSKIHFNAVCCKLPFIHSWLSSLSPYPNESTH